MVWYRGLANMVHFKLTSSPSLIITLSPSWDRTTSGLSEIWRLKIGYILKDHLQWTDIFHWSSTDTLSISLFLAWQDRNFWSSSFDGTNSPIVVEIFPSILAWKRIFLMEALHWIYLFIFPAKFFLSDFFRWKEIYTFTLVETVLIGLDPTQSWVMGDGLEPRTWQLTLYFLPTVKKLHSRTILALTGGTDR